MEPLNNTEPQTYDNFEKDKKKMDRRSNKIVYKYNIMRRVVEVYDSTELKSKHVY
ncbi:hypothetical protein ABCY62_04310 [Acetivibrio clariflavus]|uniref:hypothetical protein n=1 Tax=Acetivibrio clariflavus TaxID=288965 RepID=UPI0031F55A0A